MEKPRFEWQNFIEVSDEWGEKERADIIATLDQLEPLHIMQETLRDIPLNKLYDWQPDKILIEPAEACNLDTTPAIVGYEIKSRRIVLPHHLKMNFGYKDKNKNWHAFSLTRILLHELQHTIDPQVKMLDRETITLIAKEANLPEKEAYEQLDYGISEGINFLDTAEVYAIPPNPKTQ